MSIRKIVFVSALLGTLMTGCAGLPAGNGRADVQALLKERGHELPAETAANPLLELQGGTLDATAAVRLALVNNPALGIEYAKLGFAAADVYDAGRLANPHLSASLLVPDVGGTGNQTGFGVAQNFSSLLLLSARGRFAAGNFEKEKQTVGAHILALAADTEAAYYHLTGAGQIATLREAVANAAQTAAELAQRFFDAGNINRLELATEQAAASQAHLDLLQAQAEVVAARDALARLMGISAADHNWTVANRLPLPLAEEDSAIDLLKLADSSRLDLAAARQQVSLFADALGVTRRFRLLGDVEAGVETEHETDRTRITGPTLSLELPIFNQGQGRVARAEAGLQQAEAELRVLENAIRNGVQLTCATISAAKARAAQYRESLIPLREAIVSRTQEQVNFMLDSQFRLLLVKQQEYDAYQGYLEAVRDYWLARVQLAREVGTVLPSSSAVGEATLDAQLLIQPAAMSGHEHHEGMSMEGMDHSSHDMGNMPGSEAPNDASTKPHHGEQP